ncbi:CAP domain-containing protein [Aliicoccus persicus]|uniref:CAP-associated N-terminal n=1 Tax=Aliicoccus persicus TaxID=930138 RepID=A0A662Z1H1_9STAP|nr:CAP domain-containing protein [Aliicoccus persicus]SEV86564.1 CAP-associated N-terminal [Aliicoccus persicus]
MIRKLIFLLFAYVFYLFVTLIIQSFDFDEGFSYNAIQSWAEEYVYQTYDMTIIEEVNSNQTQSIEYMLGQTLDLEGHDVLESEYVGDFRVIQQNDHFRMVLVKDGVVTGGYTNSSNVAFDRINIEGLFQSDIREIYGEPESHLRRGMKRMNVQNDEYDVFDLGDRIVYFFYDIHRDYAANGMLIFMKDEYTIFDSLYNHPSEENNERMLFYLVNATRQEYGYSILQRDETAVDAARGHSIDMATNNYFEHVSPSGVVLKDRLQASNVAFRFAGENIATGHTSSIFVHHSLLNSMDHRKNLLHPDFTHLGIGVAYNELDVPYYTENYVQK